MRTWTIYMLNIEYNKIKTKQAETTTTTKQLALCSPSANRNSIAQGIHNWLGKYIYVYDMTGTWIFFREHSGCLPVNDWVSKGARVCVSIVRNKINDLIDLLTSHEKRIENAWGGRWERDRDRMRTRYIKIWNCARLHFEFWRKRERRI